MTTVATKIATFALTLVVSATMILGAVGPAEFGVAPTQASQTIA